MRKSIDRIQPTDMVQLSALCRRGSSLAKANRLLTAKLRRIGMLNGLDINMYDQDTGKMENWTELFHALAENQFVIKRLDVWCKALQPMTLRALFHALTSNTTVQQLTLTDATFMDDDEYTNACKQQLWADLCRLLRTRKATLDVSLLLDLQVWAGNGDDPELKSPAFLHWSCVHQASITVFSLPLSWANIENLAVRSMIVRDHLHVDRLLQFVRRNKITHLELPSYEHRAIKEMNNQPFTFNTVERLTFDGNYVSTGIIGDRCLRKLPALRNCPMVLTPWEAMFWIKHPSISPCLSAITIDNLDWLPTFARLVKSRPTAYSVALWDDNCQPLPTLAAKFRMQLAKFMTRHSITELSMAVSELHLTYLRSILSTSDNAITTLCLYFPRMTLNQNDMCTQSLFEILTLHGKQLQHICVETGFFRWPGDEAPPPELIHEIIQRSCPRLITFPLWEIDCGTHRERLQPTTSLLQQRQTVYVQKRDAWQQLVLMTLMSCTQHTLANGALDWLPTLRQFLGGATTLPGETLNSIIKDQKNLAWFFPHGAKQTQTVLESTASRAFSSALSSSLFARDMCDDDWQQKNQRKRKL